MTGIISSNKMTKALVVTVFTTKLHPKYKKRYSVQCSDSSKFKIGDSVEIVSTTPVSKTINFKVVE